MKRIFLAFSLIVTVLLVAGCAAEMPSRSEYVKEKSAPIVLPNNDYAVIYFLRQVGGIAVSYFIEEDTKRIGLLKSGSYFIHRAKPGKHTYTASTESTAATTITVEPNKIYYIEGVLDLGVWIGRPGLREITEPVAKQYLPDLDYVRLATPEETEAYKLKEQSDPGAKWSH